LGGFRVRGERTRAKRGFASPKPRTSRPSNTYTSQARYLVVAHVILQFLTLLSTRVCRPRPTRRTSTHPITHNHFSQREYYTARVRVRDPYCLIPAQPVVGDDFCRFQSAHIFPHAYDIDVRASGLVHSADIGYRMGQQRLPKSYYRSCTPC
jgi:hypothetical protein